MIEIVQHVLGLCPDSGSHVNLMHALLAGGGAAVGVCYCWACRLARILRGRR
jgi:hypothetical protein